MGGRLVEGAASRAAGEQPGEDGPTGEKEDPAERGHRAEPGRPTEKEGVDAAGKDDDSPEEEESHASPPAELSGGDFGDGENGEDMEELKEGGLVPSGELFRVREPALGRVSSQGPGHDSEQTEKGGETEEESIHGKTSESGAGPIPRPAESTARLRLASPPELLRGKPLSIMSVSESVPGNNPVVRAQRLLFLTHEFPPAHGGAGTVTREWARAATRLGWEVEVLAAGKEDPVDRAEPYPVVRMGHRGRQDLRARRALLRYLRARSPRPGERWIVSEPGALRALLDASPGELPPAPAPSPLVLLHGSEILRFTSRRGLRGRLRALLERADRVVVLSAANRTLLRECLPGLSTECQVVPGAASGSSGAPATGERTPTRGASPDRLTLLTVGRVHPRKGQREVLAALRQLPADCRARVRYHLVGPAVHRGYARGFRQDLRRADFPVEWKGAVGAEELDAAYRAADLFVLASQPYGRSLEGFGLVYLEAGRYGLPVVGTRNGGVGEAIADGETGLLVPPGDPQALAGVLERLLRSPGERIRLGAAGRQRAHAWTWQDAVALALGPPAKAKTD